MKLKVRSQDISLDKKHTDNGTEINYPGEYGNDFITIYTNDWAVNYEIKLRGRKPYLKFVNRERAYR